MLKICTMCHEPKPLNQFHRLVHSPDGHQPLCGVCKSTVNASTNPKNNPRNNKRNAQARRLAGVTTRVWCKEFTAAQRAEWRSVSDDLTELGATYEGAVTARETRRDGIVYVITHPRLTGVKIGKAFDAESRLRGYQTGCPERAYTLSYVSTYTADCAALEKAVHESLASTRLQGEWFAITVDQAVQSIKEINNA